MNQTFKRALALLLTLCMVVSMFPAFALTAKAAENQYLPKGQSPEDTDSDNITYTAGDPWLSCDRALTGEHKHTNDCYALKCGHDNGHIGECYGFKYNVCPGGDHDHQKTILGSEIGSDAGALYEAYLSVFNNAYSALKDEDFTDVYYNGYGDLPGYNAAKLSFLKDAAGKAAVAAAKADSATNTANKTTFCAVYDENDIKCGHGDAHVEIGMENSCYELSLLKGCKLYEHTHVDPDCYSVTWTPKDDRNNNSTPDEDEKYTVVYKYNLNDGNGEQNTTYTDQTWNNQTPAAPSISRDYYDLSWSPVVANKVAAPTSGTTITYTAVWTPKNDVNTNNVADEEEEYTVVYQYDLYDGSSVQTVEHKQQAYGAATPAAPSVARTNYNLSWTPAVAATIATPADGTTITYTAEWTPKNDKNGNGEADEEELYTVTYKYVLNGEEKTETFSDLAFGAATPAAENAVRENYSIEWKPAVAAKVATPASGKTIAYEGSWRADLDDNGNNVSDKEELYTVTFVYPTAPGEETTTKTETGVAWNTAIATLAPAPAVVNWTLVWSPSIDGVKTAAVAKVYDAEGNVINDGTVLNYKGEWVENGSHLITFHGFGDVVLDMQQKLYEADKVVKADALPNATSDGHNYVFDYWYYLDADNNEVNFETLVGQTISENYTIYSKWFKDDNENKTDDATETNYTIIYRDGKDGEIFTEVKFENVLPGSTPKYDDDNAPSAEGYIFKNWTPEWKDTLTGSDDETAEIVYTATWAKDSNKNGVDDEEETLTITAAGEGKGTVTVNGEEKPAYVYDSANGEKIVIAAKPADGSYVAAITNNGEAVTLDESKFAERTYTYELVIGQPVMTTADDETAEPKKGHAVSVTFAEAKFTLKDSPYLPVKEEKVYTEEELYTSAITAPAYDEAKVEVKGYLARPKTTLSAFVKEFEVFGQTYGGKTYTFDLPEIWESDLTAVYEYTDPQTLVDNTINTIEDNISKGTIDGLLAAAKALSNLQNLNLGSLGCHSFGYDDGVKFVGEEIIRVTYTSNAVVIDDPQVPVWTRDERQTTTLTIADQSIPYDPNLTSAALLSKLAKNTNAQGGEYTLLENMDGADVGEYTITVKYSGSTTHKPTTATAKVTITPAPAAVNVPFNYVRYGEAYSKPVITSGENDVTASVDHVTIIAGLDLANKATFVQMILPEMLQQMVNNMGLSFTVGDILDGLSALTDALDADKLNQIKAAVAEVPGIEEIANTQVIVGGNYPANTGTYLIGVVTADTNYETAYGLNMLVIHPDGAKLDLAWIEDDSNGLYTLEALKSGKHDLGAEITTVYETIEGVDPADYLDVMFVGVDVNEGAGIITDVNDLTIGTYTEIAYMRDLGNQMYYAEPLVRQVTVISDLVSVEFVDANDNNIRTFENDGNPHAMEAVATHRDGIALDQNNLTYRIYGMESDGDLYEGTFSHAEILAGNVGPKNTGTYTVIATYRDSAVPEYIGIGVGALIINPKPAAISVNDMIRPYEDSRSDSLMSLIQKDPADAKMAVMVAGITNIGDFSEDGLAAVEGTVYIDLPQRVEDAINTVKGNELVTVDNFKALLAPLAGALEATGMDISAVQAFYDELAALPGTLNVQIADLTDYQFSKIGAYVVVAGIMDNDYYPAVDSGLVVIHPEIEEYTLGWNHADTNGILTRISLDSKVDLKASAQNAEGELVEDAAIKYLVYGFEKDGAEVKLTGTDEDIEGKIHALRDGVYTQVAYIETEIDAEMVIAMAINRQLILMTESVTVEAPNQEYVYGDEIDYVSKITVTDPYHNHEFTAEELTENLTVKFAGINGTEIGYYSEEVPSDAGSYAVFAQYKQEENGDIKYFGIGLGTLTIKPAALDYDIVDSYHKYDGTQKAPEVKKPVTGIHDILFIVDTQNASVNVIAPSLGQDSNNWDGDLHIQYWLDELNTILANQNINKDELISKLDALISKLAELGIVEEDVLDNLLAVVEQIDSDLLTLNKVLPVGKEKSVCKYNVYGIAFKDMNHAIEIAEGVLTIGDGYPIYFQPGDANGMIEEGTTVFVDDVAYALDENCVAWADDKDRELAIGYVYRNSGNHTTDHAYSDTTKNMYIWDLQWNEETNSYKADRVEELDNLLSFAGGSIWLGSNGVNGIRTYYATTADTEAVKGAFRNLGYEVVTHGVVVGWADKLNGSEPVPNGNNSASGHAAGNGAYYDEIYPAADKYITPDLRARFYVELKNVETSETKIIYSGSVERSIGYIAYQNIDIVAAQYQPYVKAILDKAAAAGFTYGGK